MRDLGRLLVACVSMLAIVACSDDSPTEPEGGGGTPGGELVLAEVEPASGAAGGGDRVTVRGGGFEEPVDVRFDGRAAIVESVADDRVEVVTPASSQPVPAGLTRDVDVSVTVGSGALAETRTLSAGFTYLPGGTDGGGDGSSLEVTSVSPVEGHNGGGTRITLEGEGFESPVRVLFGQGDTAPGFVGIQATVESTGPTRVVVVSPSALGFTIDNRNQIVDLLVQNQSSGQSVIVPEAFRYRD